MEHGISANQNESTKPQKSTEPPETGIWIHTNKHHRNFDNKKGLPPRVNHGQAYDEKTQNLYIVGGFYEYNEGNQATSASTIDIQCINMESLENVEVVTSVHIIDKVEHYSDFYTEKFKNRDYEFTNNYWNQTTELLKAPLARYGLAATFMNDKIYIYGGHNDHKVLKTLPEWYHNLSSVFEFDPKTGIFQNLTDISKNHPEKLRLQELPGIRSGHCLIALPKINSLLVFGGFCSQMRCERTRIQYTERAFRNDLWLFCITTRSWHRIWTNSPLDGLMYDDSVSMPVERDFGIMHLVNDKLVLYGGRSFGPATRWAEGFANDCWVIDNFVEHIPVYQDTLGDILPLVDAITQVIKIDTRWRIVKIKENEHKSGAERSEDEVNNSGDFFNNVFIDHIADTYATTPLLGADGEPNLNLKTLIFPPPRRSHMSFVRNSNIYIFGGFGGDTKGHFSDLWKFDCITEEFSEVKWPETNTSSKLYGRRRGSVVYLEKHDIAVVLLGTRQAQTEEERTWLRLRGKEETEKSVLWKHRGYDLFAFGTSLQNICLGRLVEDYEEYAKDGNISEVREIETSVGCFGQMSEQIEFILNPKMTEVKSLDDELSYEASEMDDG